MAICRDRFARFGWYILDRETGTMVFSLNPVDRRWVFGSWFVANCVTGDILDHGTWQKAWMRYPPPGRRASPFSLWE